MGGGKTRNKLIPSKDDDQNKPKERPRILSSEYRHCDRKQTPGKAVVPVNLVWV